MAKASHPRSRPAHRLLAMLAVAALLPTAVSNAFVWMALDPTNAFYNQDVIFENANPTIAPNAFGARRFYEDGLQAAGQPQGLRPDRTYMVTLGGDQIPVVLQPYTGPNQRNLSAAGDINAATGTLVTMNVPLMHYDAIALSFAAGNNTATTGQVRLNYTDGTSSDVTSFNIPNWGAGAFAGQAKVFTVGRANVSGGLPAIEGGSNWGIFTQMFDADDTKVLESLTLAMATTSTNFSVFAFSGLAPEPSRAVLLGLGALLFIGRRRRQDG